MKKSHEVFEELVSVIRQEFIDQINNGFPRPLTNVVVVSEGKDRRRPGSVLDKALRNGPLKPATLRKLAKGEKRKPSDLGKVQVAITNGLKKGPLRAEPLAVAIGYSTKEIRLPITKLLASKAIKKTGQKRATVYRLA